MPDPMPTADDVARAMAVIAPYVRQTPVFEISGRDLVGADATLVLKLELLQHSGSFKARGASHFVATQPIGPAGIVAASGGNHGAAVAWAARRFGHEANIFVPTIAAPAKVARLEQYDAVVHQVGSVYAEALRASEAYVTDTGATSIHAYDDPVVMAGAGTCTLELDRQAGALDAVMLACGGGGLSGGAACWIGDRAEIVVCETVGTATYAAAVERGSPVDVEVAGLAADALGASRLGDRPWQALSSVGATSVVVDDDDLVAARDLLWERLRIVVEPAAAAPLAALMTHRWTSDRGARVGVVLCGANTTVSLPRP